MQIINCNFCGHNDTDLINQGADLLLNLPGEFCLVQCKNCGLIYQNPQLTAQELTQHYSENYLPYKTDSDKTQSLAEKASLDHSFIRQYQRINKRHPTPGLLLDVGCATGLFLRGMQSHGWRVKGVEPNEFAAAYARKTFDLDIFSGTLAAAAFPDATFDTVTLWDVLEHVHDPMETLEEVYRIIKPGGLLVISLPNPTSIETRLFGSHWVGWERPRHLFLFTPTLIETYLKKTGFTLDGIESFNGRLSLTLLSIEFLLKAKKIPDKKWRFWLRAAYNWPLRILTWPIYRLAEQFNQTSIMTIFATRNDLLHKAASKSHVYNSLTTD